MNIKLNTLKEELEAHVKEKILPFWLTKMVDHENGGFYGWATDDGKILNKANKGAVLNTRILWTFSAAYRLFGDEQYLEMAERSWEYIEKFFVDNKYGGIYWMLDYRGNPVQPKKQIYALAFAIYAFSEYYNATGNPRALDLAQELFKMIEKYSFDPDRNGYFEAFNYDWKMLEDLRLSNKDANERKTLNTHLHVLEAYTRLASVYEDNLVKKRLVNLSITCKLAETILNNAVAEDGSLYNEVTEEKRLDDDRHWWPQAEAIVGFMNAYQHTGDEKYVTALLKLWDFIKRYFVHPEYGEWYFRIDKKYQPYHEEEFAGPWKGPYHNGRMCFELIRRIEELHQK